MANILILVNCPLTEGGEILQDARLKNIIEAIQLGVLEDANGIALPLDTFDFQYITTECCYTASGVVSPTKWKKNRPEELTDIVEPYKAIVTIDATTTALFTKDRYFTAVKNKYSYKGVAVFPLIPPSSLEGMSYLEAMTRIDNAYTLTVAGEVLQPALTECIIIENVNDIWNMRCACIASGLCVVDVETNEIDNGKKEGRIRYFMEGFRITTLSISPEAGVSYVMSIQHKDKVWDEADFNYLIKVLQEIMAHPDIIKVAHNLKYDLNAMSAYGITQYGGRFADTMLMAHLLNENEAVGLERLTEIYLPTFHGYKVKNFNLPFMELAKYNAQDTDNTCRLFYFLELKLRQDPRLYKIFRSLTMPAFWVLFNAERHGAVIDKPFLEKSIEECKALIERKRAEMLSHPTVRKFLYHKALREERARCEKKKIEYVHGDEDWVNNLIDQTEINFGSPKQLSELLYGANGFGIVAFDESENDFNPNTSSPTSSTKHDVLVSIDDPFVTTLLEFRGLEKSLGTFFEGINDKVHDGRIHASFRQTGTVTGRLSMSEPNLQQIPSRTSIKDEEVAEMIMRVKKFFNAPDGYKVMQGDFSQLELRLIAMFSPDANMIKAYGESMDLHCLCAAQINNMSYEDFMAKEVTDPKWWKSQRSCGKGANFSLSYGCSAATYRIYCKATYGIKISEKEAELHHKNYFKRFPAMVRWHEDYKEKAREFGHVRTFFGRTRTLPDIISRTNSFKAKAERQSINSPVQGTGGELALFLICIANQVLPPSWYNFFNTVHDSLMYYVKEEKVTTVGEMIQNITSTLQDFFPYFDVNMSKWNVPLVLDVEFGDSWGTIKKG